MVAWFILGGVVILGLVSAIVLFFGVAADYKHLDGSPWADAGGLLLFIVTPVVATASFFVIGYCGQGQYCFRAC